MKPDPWNELVAYWRALDRESPGKTWWNGEAMHSSIFRALRMDRTEAGAIYAAAAFRLAYVEERPAILVAFPAPRLFAPHDDDNWLGIETVLAWNPRTDEATILGEAGPTLIGKGEEGQVFGSAFAFLRAYAEARAQWFVGRTMIAGDWRRKPAEPDLTPGLLLLGKPDEVRWPLHALPETVQCHGVDAKAVNRALLRQARIPRAANAPSSLARAA